MEDKLIKNIDYAPICLFAYNRLDETKKTVSALQKNYLAEESELFIFSDGAKNEIEKFKVDAVRAFLKSVDGFKKVTIFESVENKGLANSIILGVDKVLNKYDEIIVLEDDLITSPNFLDFMNQSLVFYKSIDKIFSISGYTMDLPSLNTYDKDFYFGYRASSWGWGVWRDRWTLIDWEVSDYESFKRDKDRVQSFKRGGSDMPRMLRNQMNGKIDSWAIRFCYHQFKEDLMTVFPTKSKVESIGFSKEATHTSGSKRFLTPVDLGIKKKFVFENLVDINQEINQDFLRKTSIWARVVDNFFNRLK